MVQAQIKNHCMNFIFGNSIANTISPAIKYTIDN